MGASWLCDGFQVMFPAECHVVPEPSRSRSSSSTSPTPRVARCQAMLAPTIPPPITMHFMRSTGVAGCERSLGVVLLIASERRREDAQQVEARDGAQLVPVVRADVVGDAGF